MSVLCTTFLTLHARDLLCNEKERGTVIASQVLQTKQILDACPQMAAG